MSDQFFLGVHAIFGGFLAGLIIPHEGGFAIALTEKLEDLVSILLLPLVSFLVRPPVTRAYRRCF